MPTKNKPVNRRSNGAHRVETVVIGGGQAGLCVSYFLKRHGIEHAVLEKSEIGARWYDRWDSFTLVTPNAMNALPGMPATGASDDFLPRDAVIRYLQDFADSFDPPIQFGVEVNEVRPGDHGFHLTTSKNSYRAQNVVVATGTFQHARVPDCAEELPADIFQIHSNDYRNPSQLPQGAVLVVGSGQSGAQIADELHEAGRKVYLSVSGSVRIPRRYRGRDIMEWLQMIGLFERTADQLESPAERFAAHPHVSGRGGGRTLNLRRFGREGMVLMGKVAGASGDCVFIAPNLEESLQAADDFVRELCDGIDQLIEKNGLEAPAASDEEVVSERWHPPEELRELRLSDAGIRSVVWATGYSFDYSWVKAPVFDAFGYPAQQKGVTTQPGLYFAGMHWLHKQKSGLLYGVAEDAKHVAGHIAEKSAVSS